MSFINGILIIPFDCDDLIAFFPNHNATTDPAITAN